jgi:hypothetical protein
MQTAAAPLPTDARSQLWLWHYPEPDDLTLLVIKQTGTEDHVEYELHDAWFHEYSCPSDRRWGRDAFDKWRSQCSSEEITRMIGSEELTPIVGIDQIPHWVPA